MFPQKISKQSSSNAMQAMVTKAIQKERAAALTLLDSVAATPRTYGRSPYLCLGCQVGAGKVREEIIALVIYPLYRKVMESLLGHQLVLQAYHPQAQEDNADTGPGGVIGIRLLGGKLDTSPSTSVKMWHWVNEATNFPYKSEEDAEKELWELTEARCEEALKFLTALTEDDLHTPVHYHPRLRHQMHTLLGITAVRNLLTAKLGKNMVLVDEHRLIGEDFLRWEHFYQ